MFIFLRVPSHRAYKTVSENSRFPTVPMCFFHGPVLLTLLLQHGIMLGIIGEETPDILLHNERGPAAREGKAQLNQPPYSDSTTSASKK